MNYIGTQNFETKRCFLRRIKLSDYTMMYENWAKYDEVCRYYPFNPVDDIEIYRDKVKHWISNYESDSYFHWVIEWKETGELIGTINLGNVEEACHMCDTCYMLSPGFWNKGIMTEVLEAVLDYAFDRVGFNRVQAEVFYGNDASSAVLKKCGMVLEGIARQKYYKNGEVCTSYTGLTLYYGTWYYVERGVLNWNYTGLTKYYGTWYYVQKGILNWKYNGIVYHNGVRYTVTNGVAKCM